MSDPIAAAFVSIPTPEASAGFERRVVAQVMAKHQQRQRRERRLLRAYWLSAIAISTAAVASVELSALVMLTGTAALAGTTAAAVLAAGGVQRMTRVLRTTVS